MKEDFDLFFKVNDGLETKTNGHPERLRRLVKEQEQLGEAFWLMSNLVRELEEQFRTEPTKDWVVPRGFIWAWQEYHSKHRLLCSQR